MQYATFDDTKPDQENTPDASDDLTACGPAATGLSSDAELLLKRRRIKPHDNQALDQGVGSEEWVGRFIQTA